LIFRLTRPYDAVLAAFPDAQMHARVMRGSVRPWTNEENVANLGSRTPLPSSSTACLPWPRSDDRSIRHDAAVNAASRRSLLTFRSPNGPFRSPGVTRSPDAHRSAFRQRGNRRRHAGCGGV